MAELEKIYKEMTDVDLDARRQIWDERTKGYFGEYRLFEKLFLSMNGCCKFLGNVLLPTADGGTTELDLVMIHETGIYVFENKHYKGTIYGKSSEPNWTQYFRTAPNQKFKNPILQNQYHVSAMRRFFPNIPIYSVIVFSRDDCDIRNIVIDTHDPYLLVTNMQSIPHSLQMFISGSAILGVDGINDIFSKLSAYSPMQEATVEDADGKCVPVYDFVHRMKADFDGLWLQKQQQTAREKERELKAREKKLNKRWSIILSVSVCVCLVAALAGTLLYGSYCDWQVEKAQAEIEEPLLEQELMNKWDVYDAQRLFNDMIEVSSDQLRQSTNTRVMFDCSLLNKSSVYGLQLNRNTQFVVTLTDGTVRVYDMFGERLSYDANGQRLGPSGQTTWLRSGKLATVELKGISSKDDIQHIKLINLSIWKQGVNNNIPFMNGLELELYSAY